MIWTETRGFDVMPGTTAQVEALINKQGKKGWEFMAFGERRNDKGKVLPGVTVWLKRVKMNGHG